MAEKYPKIARSIWWSLRDRFKKTIPATVTPTFIISVANMTEDSARSNVLAPLRQLGLVAEDGKPTDLVKKWRDDTDYKAACHEIRAKIYPQELIDAFPDGGGSEEAIKGWFMKKASVGEAAAKMFAKTYLLLSEADVSKREDTNVGTIKPAKIAAKPKNASSPAPAREKESNQSKEAHHPSTEILRKHPSIHVDVQVHISPETTPEQIDKIFESMSKHLGNFSKP
jgi:hypothetical protein